MSYGQANVGSPNRLIPGDNIGWFRAQSDFTCIRLPVYKIPKLKIDICRACIKIRKRNIISVFFGTYSGCGA